MPVRRMQQKFERWRQEPEDVRLRIATFLTLGSGAALAVLWLAVLLPLQLHFSRPSGPDTSENSLRAVVDQLRQSQVAGLTTSPMPSPTPTPDVQYFHGTRPTTQQAPADLP